MLLPIGTFVAICGAMIYLGLRDRARSYKDDIPHPPRATQDEPLVKTR